MILSLSLANYFEFCQLVPPPSHFLLLHRLLLEVEKLRPVSMDTVVRHSVLFHSRIQEYLNKYTAFIFISSTILFRDNTNLVNITLTLHSFKWIWSILVWIFLEFGRWFYGSRHHIFMAYVFKCSHPWSSTIQIIVCNMEKTTMNNEIAYYLSKIYNIRFICLELFFKYSYHPIRLSFVVYSFL